MKNILVTGATGLLGSRIVSKLVASKEYKVCALVRKSSDLSLIEDSVPYIELRYGDITDIPALELALAHIDVVIHSAAYVSYDPGHDDLMRHININGTANMINVSLTSGVKKFVHISSVAAIGRSITTQFYDENTKWVRSPQNSPYGISKYQAEQEAWRGNYEGMPVTILNPSLIFGVGDFTKTSLVIIDKVLASKGFHPVGSNAIVDVDDVAQASLLAIDPKHDGERYIIAAHNVTYKELYESILSAYGKTMNLRPLPCWLAKTMIGLGWVKYKLTGKTPLLSEMAYVNSALSVSYNNEKSKNNLGLTYRPMADTIADIVKAHKATLT